MIQRKYLFPKSVEDACSIMAGWKNCYGKKNHRFDDANDGGGVSQLPAAKTRGAARKRKLNDFMCKKIGHYSNDCDESDEEEALNKSNKKESSFLVLKKTSMIVALLKNLQEWEK